MTWPGGGDFDSGSLPEPQGGEEGGHGGRGRCQPQASIRSSVTPFQGTNLRRSALDLTLTRPASHLSRSWPWNAMVNRENCIS